MYTKFHEIELDQPTWAVALLTTVEQKETKSKQPFCVFTLQDGEKTIQANIWNTQKENVKLEQGLISVQLYKKIYNGTESWEVKAYDAAPLDAKMEDFIITAPIPSEQMLQKILAILTKEIGTDGLRALLRMLNCGSITEETYGYLLGPVCNASGRILDDGAKDVFQLISRDLDKFSLTYDQDFLSLHDKAEILIERNEKRKKMTQTALQEIQTYINLHKEVLEHSVLVMQYGSVESLGIVGLVAGELAEQYQRPAFVFAKTSIPGVISGSARTYGNIHLKNEILEPSGNLLLSAGGHAEAAGTKARHNVTNRLLNQMSGGQQIPPVLLMRFFDQAMDLLLLPETQWEIRQKQAELQAILPDLQQDDQFIYGEEEPDNGNLEEYLEK